MFVCSSASCTTVTKSKTTKATASVWSQWGTALTEKKEELPNSNVLDRSFSENVVRRSLRRLKHLVNSEDSSPALGAEIPPPEPDIQHRIFVSRLTNRAVFNKLRLYLTYFCDNPGVWTIGIRQFRYWPTRYMWHDAKYIPTWVRRLSHWNGTNIEYITTGIVSLSVVSCYPVVIPA